MEDYFLAFCALYMKNGQNFSVKAQRVNIFQAPWTPRSLLQLLGSAGMA